MVQRKCCSNYNILVRFFLVFSTVPTFDFIQRILLLSIIKILWDELWFTILVCFAINWYICIGGLTYFLNVMTISVNSK